MLFYTELLYTSFRMYKNFTCYLLILLLSGCNASNNAIILTNNTSLASIPLELTTHLGDQQQFVEGDEIQFLLSLGQDAYIYMFYIDAAKNINQILPNDSQPDHYYSAGYFLTIPEYDNLYRFTINKPFGEETIWIFASDRSIALDDTTNTIDEIKEKIKQSSAQAFGEYQLRIETRAE